MDCSIGLDSVLKQVGKIFQRRVICCDVREGNYNELKHIFAHICQELDILFIDAKNCIENAFDSDFK